jgi:aryl-alcohol dehydrogenase-like predicted oxidoreductase
VIAKLIEIGKNRGNTPSQVALNWLVNQPCVTTVILGARTLDQLKENMGCVGWKLSEEEKQALNLASQIDLPYPYRFIQRYTRKRNSP